MVFGLCWAKYLLLLHCFVILIDNLLCLIEVLAGNGNPVHWNAAHSIQRGKGAMSAILNKCSYFRILQQTLNKGDFP